MKNLRLIFILAGLYVLFFSCGKQEPEISRSIADFNDDDRKAVLDIIKHAPAGKPMALDLADDSHYRFIKKQYYMAGANEDTHPQLFKKLEDNRSRMKMRKKLAATSARFMLTGAVNAEPTEGISEITSFIASPSTNVYTTSGLLSYPFGTIQTATTSIGLYTNTGVVIDTPAYATGYSAAALTKLAVSSKAVNVTEDSVYALYAYVYLDNQDSLKHGVIKAVTANVVDSIVNIAPSPCVVGQVVPGCSATCTNGKVTTVCMTRNVPNCTYCNTGFANNLMFPLQGYVRYTGNVNVGSDGKPNHGAFASVTLTRLPAGGGCPAIPVSGTFFNYVTVQGNKLSWNLPQALFPNTCLQSGDSVLFQLTLYVTVGSQFLPAFATISNSPKVQPPALRIAPIQVVSGCLGAGTRITLDNGKKMAIENVPIDGFVLSAAGQKLQVNYNTTGTEAEPSYRIKTGKGHSLLLTGAHPVVTPQGVKQARELREGDVVITDQGELPLSFVGREQYDGVVWNLAVSKPGEEDKNTGRTTFFAEGILVGDHKMQNTILYRSETHEDILKRLSPEWHTDYLNSRKQKQN